MYLGTYKKGTVVFCPFTTFSTAGSSITIATNGTAKAYINGGTTEITTGVTLVEDHDGITGRHGITVDTSDVAFTAGSDVDVALDNAVVDGVSVSCWIAKFSIERDSIERDSIVEDKLDTVAGNITTILSNTVDIETKVDVLDGLIDTILANTVDIEAKIDILDSVANIIRGKTDQLTFTETGVADVNLQMIRNIPLTGNGSTDPFDVA